MTGGPAAASRTSGKLAVARPSLIAFTFAPLSFQDENEANDVTGYLAGIWGCWKADEKEGGLGAHQAIAGLGSPSDFTWPPMRWDNRLHIVSAAQRSDKTCAVLAFAKHDVVILAASIDTTEREPTLDTWSRLFDEWRNLSGTPPTGLLGQALLFVAALEEPAISDDRAREVEDDVFAALPTRDQHDQKWRFRTSHGVFWGVERSIEESRVMGALAPVGSEGSLLKLVWWNEHEPYELVPFASYLLHAAKLRSSVEVYNRDIGTVRTAQDAVDADVARVMRLHEDAAGRAWKIEEMIGAQDTLTRDQAAAAGLLAQMTRLRELKQTIEIARKNIELWLPELCLEQPWRGRNALPFGTELELAARLGEQIEYDISYAEAVRERGEDTRELTRLRVARLQNRLTTIQSAFIGGLLAGLGAIQALDPNIDLAEHLRLPVVALVTGFVLAAPLLVVHLFERYRSVDYIAACVLGAATGWFAVSLVWSGPAPGWQWLGALVGAVLLFICARLLDKAFASARAP